MFLALPKYSVIHCHHSFRSFRAQSLNLMECGGTHFRVVAVKIQRSRFGMFFNRGPHELRERVGRGETAATSTSRASSLLQARFDVEQW